MDETYTGFNYQIKEETGDSFNKETENRPLSPSRRLRNSTRNCPGRETYSLPTFSIYTDRCNRYDKCSQSLSSIILTIQYEGPYIQCY